MVTKKQNSEIKPDRRTIALYGALALVVLWLIIDAIGVGGNIRFYAKWLECEQRPVVRYVEFGSVGPSSGPSYYIEAPSVKLFRLSPDQFCTPIEAERAGLSATKDTWSFPHLEAAGEDNPFLRSLN